MAMTLRENLTERQRWAHAVLDDVRDGLAHSHRDVREALRVLGDLL
jgi:hypothetical protein